MNPNPAKKNQQPTPETAVLERVPADASRTGRGAIPGQYQRALGSGNGSRSASDRGVHDAHRH